MAILGPGMIDGKDAAELRVAKAEKSPRTHQATDDAAVAGTTEPSEDTAGAVGGGGRPDEVEPGPVTESDEMRASSLAVGDSLDFRRIFHAGFRGDVRGDAAVDRADHPADNQAGISG